MGKRKSQGELFEAGAPIDHIDGPWREDAIIRSVGFKIHARPESGYDAAVWEREGRRYLHDEALSLAVSERENQRRQDEAKKRGEL